MTVTRGYATFDSFDPGFTGKAWEMYGSTYSHTDYSNSTGAVSGDLTGYATYEHVLGVQIDSTIPTRSVFQYVQLRLTLGMVEALSVAAAGLGVLPYIRYQDGPPIYLAEIRPAYLLSMNDYVVQFTRDPNGYPWALNSIFRLRGERLLFGLRTVIPDPLPFSARIFWSECRFEVGFVLPTPVIVPDPATWSNVGGSNRISLLTATIDPRSATSTYPVSYYVQYGTTAAYGSRTSITTGLTGDGPAFVSTGWNGTAGITYHYRWVMVTGEGNFYSDDFTTHPI
jgi:hypothetical protein